MDQLLIAMSVFALVGATSPGPVNLVATSTAANFGFPRTLLFVSGASVAYALIVFVSGNLLSILVNWLPNLERVMQIAGTVFLLYVVKQIAFAPYEPIEHQSQRKVPSLVYGGLMQCINPKAWLVAMSGISLYVVGQESLRFQLITFTMVSLVACFIGVSSWAAIGHLIRRYLQSELHQRRFNTIMAGLLLVSISSIWL
mgnify:CR=1 FL=1